MSDIDEELYRLSCHCFRANENRLLLSVLAYNLGNLWRRLGLPTCIRRESLKSIQQRLVKTDIGWRQRPPIGRRLFEILRGRLTYWVSAHSVRQADVKAVMEGARNGSFFRAADYPPTVQVFMGEHAWSPAAAYVGADWRVQRLRLNETHIVSRWPASVEYLLAGHGEPRFDSRLVQFPSEEIVERGGLRWCARGADFMDAEGNRAAYDPSAHAIGPSMLLLREDWTTEFLSGHELALVWLVSGVKSVNLRDPAPAPGTRKLEISGAYVWTESGPEGFVNHQLSEPVPERARASWRTPGRMK